MHDFFGGLGQSDRARLDQLQQENDRLRLQQRTNEYAQSRADELDALLRVANLGQYTILPAQVIAVTPAQGFSNTVLIDAGSKDGLKVGMTVINGDGLVGRVKSVTGVDRDGAAGHRPRLQGRGAPVEHARARLVDRQRHATSR